MSILRVGKIEKGKVERKKIKGKQGHDRQRSVVLCPTHRIFQKNTDTITTNKSTKKKCNICGRENHTTENCCYKEKPKCGKCRKFGHQTKKCWGDKPPRKGKECANIVQDEDDAEMSYVTSPVLSQNDHIVSFYPWYADSATTSHLTNI